MRKKYVFVREKGDDGRGMRECVLNVEKTGISVFPPVNLFLYLLHIHYRFCCHTMTTCVN